MKHGSNTDETQNERAEVFLSDPCFCRVPSVALIMGRPGRIYS